jgi:hypothetical protein
MKNDINENKALSQTSVKSRFFAQYWGTKTLYVGGVGKVEVGNGGWNLKHPDFFLQLKPISKITDEDAEKLMQLEAFIDGFLSDDFLNYLIELKKGYCNKFEAIDYLRSKGYAVPFMEYSVEDLVSFGWVQLV